MTIARIESRIWRVRASWHDWKYRHGGNRWPLRLLRTARYHALVPIRRMYQCGWCGERNKACVCEETYRENTAFLILDELLPRILAGGDRVTVIAYANELHPGAGERHQEYVKQRAELALERATR
jgi:hypothetical protein